MIEHHAADLVVQQLRTEKFIECCFRLTPDTADKPLSIPKRLARLRYIPHYDFHAAA